MPDNDPGQRVAVHVGDCRCPGSPHASGDEVYLTPEVSLTMGLRANGAIAQAKKDAALLELLLGLVFIEDGIVDWTFVDGKGDKFALTPENIERLLPWGRGGSVVAEQANKLYWPVIRDPLVRRSRLSSRPGPNGESTSPKTPSPSTSPRSSKSSSPESSVTLA
jgi:hypothetical protein